MVYRTPELNIPFVEKPEPPRSPPVAVKKPDKISVLWVSDLKGWAYDTVFQGLSRHLEGKYGNLVLTQCFHNDVLGGIVNPQSFDAVFLWSWFNILGDHNVLVTPIITRVPKKKTILCVASERAAPYMPIFLSEFPYMAGANRKVTNTLKSSFPESQVKTLNHGVDMDRFHPAPFPRAFTAGWAGNQLAGFKRYEMAKHICRAANVPLKLAGHLSTPEYVSCMPEWYHYISALLITSTSEVHPLVFYEALASGRPVLATEVGDISRDACRCFPVTDDESKWVDALKYLKGNPRVLEQGGADARRYVEENWGWAKIAPKYVNYIEEVTRNEVQ